MPQDAKTGRVPNVLESPDRFEGCADSKHLLIKDGTLRSSFHIESGTVIETSRMLFALRLDIQTQQARELFWNLETNLVGIFTGRCCLEAQLVKVETELEIA